MYTLYFMQFAVLSVTASVIFEDCGSAYDLHRVNILGCGMRLPCYITLGDSVPVTMEFYADFVSRQLDQDVTININFISSRTDVTPDPCATVHCPVNSDEVTSFTSVMSVPRNVAVNRRGFLQWRVYNEHDRLVLCYSVLVQTQTPAQKFLRHFKAQSSGYAMVPDKYTGYPMAWNFEDNEKVRLQKVIGSYFKNLKTKLINYDYSIQ